MGFAGGRATVGVGLFVWCVGSAYFVFAVGGDSLPCCGWCVGSMVGSWRTFAGGLGY